MRSVYGHVYLLVPIQNLAAQMPATFNGSPRLKTSHTWYSKVDCADTNV